MRLSDTRMERRLALLLVVAAAAAAPLAGSATSASSYVIRSDTYIGAFAVKRDGTLDDAIRAFGEPVSLKRQGVSCLARRPEHGLMISFYNLGGENPCLPQFGYFSQALMTGSRWRTLSGLRIGAPERHVWTRYRKAEPHGLWWWLVIRRTPFGGGGEYAGLAAKVVNGRVVAFAVNYAAGGD